MKNIQLLLFVFLLVSASSYSQESNETYIIAKGCKNVLGNMELKNCFSEKVSNLFRRGLSTRFNSELKPGINKFNLTFEVQKNKSFHLVHLNSNNPVIKKEFEKTLGKLKIIDPGIQEGEPVNATINLPVVIKTNATGVKANHKMSKVTDKNDYSGNERIYPSIDIYCKYEDEEKAFNIYTDYMLNFLFNKIDPDQINTFLNPGMNFYEVKILYSKDDTITKIVSNSGNSKLDTIFEKNIVEVLDESKFRSPRKDDVSYPGEMMFYVFYMKD
ncbi:hypothetical protein [Psychroflexus lacisalsi]|uniref:TonB C-terminal domain-containing protein n=1 Tax=Psychroflexus lacisalsi TaxID=503928 RepID=A0ABN1K623_9FLAO|nr:hypothetical protein [Psychroflexus lacisalsi]MBZ9619224.1 hypothetical protein [Psychroflexus lacisalsi]